MALKNNFTIEQLRREIGEEQIFTRYFGEWDFGSGYNSVFRDDNRASTGFYENKKGHIIYNDLASGDKYDFARFVMKAFKLNYYKAINKIAADFGLKKGSVDKDIDKAVSTVQRLKKPLRKAIIINSIRYKREHIDYWAKYDISVAELKENGIYAVDSFTINNFDEDDKLVKSFTSTPNNELKFAYTFSRDGETYIKIYTPYSKDGKWCGNVPLNLAFGLDTLRHESDTLIITKSVKDCLVLRKFFPDVIGLQNESSSSISEELLASLQEEYDNIIIWFDFDRAGIKAYNFYKRKYGFKGAWTVCNGSNVWQNLMHVKRYKIKDPSDFVDRYGINIFGQYLKYIKLL